MIKIGFKERYSDEYDVDNTYFFKGIGTEQPGDIVVVSTVYGYALGMVADIDVIDSHYNDENTSPVISIVDTAVARANRAAEKAKRERTLRDFAEKTKKNLILNKIKEINGNTIECDLLNELSFEELEKMYKYIAK